jgi:hypothetical protein
MASREDNWPLALTVSGGVVVILTLILDRHLTYDVDGGNFLTPAGQIFIIGVAILIIGLTLFLDRMVRTLRKVLREPEREPEQVTATQNEAER